MGVAEISLSPATIVECLSNTIDSLLVLSFVSFRDLNVDLPGFACNRASGIKI